MGLRCLECESDQLFGKITIVKSIPMAQKGGGFNMAGQKITQAEIKKQWSHKLTGDTKTVRGPIYCAECGVEHYYVPGAVPALRQGSYDEAVEEFGD